MTRVRLLIASIAVFGLAAFSPPDNKYAIDFPAGWGEPTVDADGNAESRAPESVGVAWCRANSVALATLDGLSQDALNTQYANPLDKATWASVLSIDPTKMEVSETEARTVDGHVVQFVTVDLAEDVMGAKAKARFASHILMGRMVNAGCFTKTESYDGLKAIFETTVSSLTPL